MPSIRGSSASGADSERLGCPRSRDLASTEVTPPYLRKYAGFRFKYAFHRGVGTPGP